METIKYIGNVFGIRIVIIFLIINKNVKIDKKILLIPLLPTFLIYSESDLLHFYYDNYVRLKEVILSREEKKQESNNILLNFTFPKITETKIIKEQDNGWDMKKDLDISIFNSVFLENLFGYTNIDKYIYNMYQVYKENNCLDLYLNYYSNYFACEYLMEQQASIITLEKMFLYAYTLEEKNGKSFYSLMNNDLRSGNTKKITRYLLMLRNIYESLKYKYLKSYSGDIYRATYFKKELIDEIKPGKKMFNSSLWSSSKNISVANKFLFKYKKNILIHTKIKEGNNIDIHLEKISQFPKEEEILVLPFCLFEIKSFEKVNLNNLEYYNLELIYCEEENKVNKIENVKKKDIVFDFLK